MKKYRIIVDGDKYRIQRKWRWLPWVNIDYYYEESRAVQAFDTLIKGIDGKVIKETDWI